MNLRAFIIAGFISLVAMQPAFSQTLELFDAQGNAVGSINKSTIHDGDILKFVDGNRFQVISYLGQGNANAVFKVRMLSPPAGSPEILALRLPLIVAGEKQKVSTQSLVTAYIDGYTALEEQSLPIPKMHSSLKGQYVASDLVESDFNGHDFFVNPEELAKRYSPEILKQAEDALVRLARMTIRFKNIGDFGPGQLVYNIKTQSWTILDWFNAHQKTKSWINKEKDTVFNNGFEADLTVTTDENGVPAGQRDLTAREIRIIRRLGLTVTAERKSMSYYRCVINHMVNSK